MVISYMCSEVCYVDHCHTAYFLKIAYNLCKKCRIYQVEPFGITGVTLLGVHIPPPPH